MSIRAVRKRVGITQTALSHISGVAREQISKYESGKLNPDVSTLVRLRDAMGCTLDELVESDGGVNENIGREGVS